MDTTATASSGTDSVHFGQPGITSKDMPARGWSTRWPAVVVFVIAMVVRLVYYMQISDSVVWQWERWDQSDMDTFLKVSNQILEGDLLVRFPYHPIHEWHENIAPFQDWRTWSLPNVFYQVPGYYYLLALFLKLSSGSLTAVKGLQMLLGAFHAALLGMIGQRVLGRWGGFIVGLLAAIYGPFIAVEPLLLREGVGLLLATMSFYLTLRALDLSSTQRLAEATRFWFLSGLVLGLGAVTKETGFVLFAAIWVWLLIRVVTRARYQSRLALSVILIGFILGMSPLILRNVAVGAQPLAFSSNAGMTFMLGNTADLPSGGVNFYEDAPSFKTIVQQSHGRFLSTVLLTLQTYSDNPTRFFRNMRIKFSAIWSNVELPDNYSYEHFTLHSPLLQFLPRFVCIWLPAIVGLLLLLTRRISGSIDSGAGIIPFSGEVLGLVLIILGLGALTMSLVPATARYRMTIVPFLMLIAGWTLSQGLAWLVHHRWTCVGVWFGLFLVVTLAWRAWPMNPHVRDHGLRPHHFRTGARILTQQANFPGAIAEFELGITYFLTHERARQALQIRRDRLLDFLIQDRVHEVLEDFRVLSRITPEDPLVSFVAKRLQIPDHSNPAE